jgi:UDP-N-acetylglucosamine--N-acetylmuramyl-(pentapeptide) pyrophosphoryl-undecaprenol N-acetylglucosamine transferase
MPKPKGKIKIVLTGGHAATTAGAVIEEINLKKYCWAVYWMGSKYAVEGKKILTLEYEYLPRLGVTFLPITTGRLQRIFTVWTIPSLLKIPLGLLESFYYLLKIRPSVVLSFGGYSSFPVVFAAKTLGIPVVIHEQTAVAGRANVLVARFADTIALARKESEKYFPKRKIVVVGNPVVKSMFSVNKKFSLGNPPAIFITGGSRGSQKINEAVGLIVPKLLGSYNVVHQTGEADFQKFEDVKRRLPSGLSSKYEVVGRIDPQKISQVFEKCDLVISRAGANTVSDIMAAGRPAILIPLPISYLDEQTKNAGFAAGLGFARIIPQSQLTPRKLLDEVKEVFLNFPKIMRKINAQESPDRTSAQKLADLLAKYVGKT